jgi:hypothetical protein
MKPEILTKFNIELKDLMDIHIYLRKNCLIEFHNPKVLGNADPLYYNDLIPLLLQMNDELLEVFHGFTKAGLGLFIIVCNMNVELKTMLLLMHSVWA